MSLGRRYGQYTMDTNKKFEILQENFYIFWESQPFCDVILRLYPMNKLGLIQEHTEKIYRSKTLKDAINSAYNDNFKK